MIWKRSQSTTAPVIWIRRPASASAWRARLRGIRSLLGGESRLDPGAVAAGQVGDLLDPVRLQEGRRDQRAAPPGALQHEGTVGGALGKSALEFGEGDMDRPRE